jgi:hypothetical protein
MTVIAIICLALLAGVAASEAQSVGPRMPRDAC